MNIKESLVLCVSAEQANIRLDKLLSDHYPTHSRRFFCQLINHGLISINSKPVLKHNLPVKPLDLITIIIPQKAESPEISPENIKFTVVFEDEYIYVINKPKNIVVHPATGNFTGTVVNGLLNTNSSLANEFHDDKERPGIIHRLDKDTSGLLITAKTQQSKFLFSKLFADRNITKEYLAVAIGTPNNTIFSGNIGRHPINRKLMAVLENGGKSASTNCKVIEHTNELSFLRLRPLTGRTHQLRVHLKHANTPILGDSIYGCKAMNNKYNIHTQLLHAHKLDFLHPFTFKKISIKANMPEDMYQIISKHIKQVELCDY